MLTSIAPINALPAASECLEKGKETAKYIPCDYHRETTRQRYAASLEALGCICRALLARNLESCCATPNAQSHRRRPTSRTSPRRSIHETFGQSSSIMHPRHVHHGTCSRRHTHKRQYSHDHGSTHEKDEKDDCCAEQTEDGDMDSCCLGDEVNDCGKDLCSDHVTEYPNGQQADLEKGCGETERIILTVQGMTCSGCEKKLVKALQTMRAVSCIETSLVHARAKFNLDISLMTVDEATTELKRVTNYSFQRIAEEIGQVLELLVPDANSFCLQEKPHGVNNIEQAGKKNNKIVRVDYNAMEIGARDLIKSFPVEVKLAPLKPDPAIATGKRQVRKEGFSFLVAAILTIPVLIFAWAPIPNPESLVYQASSLALATIIQVGVAYEFYPSAFKSLFRSRVIEMDLLIVLSTSTAYAFSVVAFAYLMTDNPLETGAFFETSTLLATLILLGRFISEIARQRATESVSIRSLQARTALLLSQDRKFTTEIDVRLLQYGDVFRVPAHSRVATDGVVVFGSSEIDESMVTGEPVPVAKGIESNVIAGSLNGTGTLDIALTHIPSQNTISAIAKAVDKADATRPKTQKIADSIAGYFVPVIVAITAIVFIIWTIVGIYVQHKRKGDAAVQGLTYAIATLIISCPCAIGLAVPMVVVIAGGVVSYIHLEGDERKDLP
jgi:Cd2+-exporting ATPase